MSLAVSADHRALRDAVRHFLAEEVPIVRVRQLMKTDTAVDRTLWSRLAKDLGLQGIAVAEEFGGAGLTFIELAHLAEECGRSLAPSSLVATMGLAIPAILASSDRVAMERYLPGIVDGSTIATVGWLSPGAGWDRNPSVQAEINVEGGWELTGTVTHVLDGVAADLLMVPATTDDGPTLFAVWTERDGVTQTSLPGFDQTRGLGKIELARAAGMTVGRLGNGAALLSTALDHADVVLAAEMIGGARACLEMSVEYAKVREQFGRQIGSFQAIKHKCAEVLVELEGAVAATRYAAWCAAENREELPIAATVAKSVAADAYFRAAAENVQIHGGIGFTWEHDAHLYFKRAKASQILFGDTGAYRRQLADRLGL